MLRACLTVVWSLVLVLISQTLPAAEQRAGERHTVFLELHQPYEKSRAVLQQQLKAEGYEVIPEGEREVVLALTAAEIRKLFGAKVIYRNMEKSATSGMASQPVLEGTRIPTRFEKLIRRVYFDPQRS